MTEGGGTSTIHPVSKLRCNAAFGRMLLIPFVLFGVSVEGGCFADAYLCEQSADSFLFGGREAALLVQDTVISGSGIEVVNLPFQIDCFL